MVRDPIVEEVRAARQKLFEACGEDLNALLDHFQEQEELDQERIVSDISARAGQSSGTSERPGAESARRSDRST
jgi:hypothetical protein